MGERILVIEEQHTVRIYVQVGREGRAVDRKQFLMTQS